MRLKVVRFAYSQGMVRSRAIERVWQAHVTVMALCGMAAPHFTYIAHVVSTLRDDIAPVCAAVLAVCDGPGLIGREMLAIDGVKLPSNASKHRSGTRVEFTQRAEQLEATPRTMLAGTARRMRWGAEHELLRPVVDALAARRTRDPVLTADAGYHTEANLAARAALEVPARIADPDLRKRDERLADREHYTRAPDPLHDKSGTAKTALPLFAPSECTYDAEARTCVSRGDVTEPKRSPQRHEWVCR